MNDARFPANAVLRRAIPDVALDSLRLAGQ